MSKEVKVISINRDKNNELVDKILSRKRPELDKDYTSLVLKYTKSF